MASDSDRGLGANLDREARDTDGGWRRFSKAGAYSQTGHASRIPTRDAWDPPRADGVPPSRHQQTPAEVVGRETLTSSAIRPTGPPSDAAATIRARSTSGTRAVRTMASRWSPFRSAFRVA